MFLPACASGTVTRAAAVGGRYLVVDITNFNRSGLPGLPRQPSPDRTLQTRRRQQAEYTADGRRSDDVYAFLDAHGSLDEAIRQGQPGL